MPAQTDRTGPRLWQALAIKHALRLYAATGIKANRSYTPSNMLKAASKITGNAYKRGQYQEAVADLAAWVDAGQPMDAE